MGLNRGPLGLWPKICRVAEVKGQGESFLTGTPVSPYTPCTPRFLALNPDFWEREAGSRSGAEWPPFSAMPCLSQEKRGGYRDRQAAFSGAMEAQFRILPFIMERKRAWLGAIPRAGSARGSLRLDPRGPLLPAKEASCRGASPKAGERLSSSPR